MTRADSATSRAPATAASTARDQHAEQRAEDPKSPSRLLPSTTRFLDAAQCQQHAGHRQAQVVPQEMRRSGQLRAGAGRGGHDF